MLKTPRFTVVRPSFQTELIKRVDAYFKDKNIRMTGNWKLYLKTAILTLTFAVFYITLLFLHPPVWLGLILCALLGINLAGIGFNVMHDGAHGSFSPFRWLNGLAANSLDFLGASSFMWKTKHNVVHHTYTNIDGIDDDINAGPLLRLAPTQKKLKIHKFQHLYFIGLYALLHMYWVFFTDFKKYFRGKVGIVEIKDMTWKDELIFWGSKLSFIIVFITLPLYMVGLLKFIIGFLIFSFSASIVLTVTFSLAHAVELADFPLASTDKNMMEDEWAVHQVKTTANFATKNKLVTWFAGGLNYQIEHHLFPRISHIHYPAISEIVKKTSAEFGIKYSEFPKVRHALLSHYLFLKRMGTAV